MWLRERESERIVSVFGSVTSVSQQVKFGRERESAVCTGPRL